MYETFINTIFKLKLCGKHVKAVYIMQSTIPYYMESKADTN